MVWFTSDWHLNETRITKEFNPFFRPFKSVEEQNKIIVNNINKLVSKRDSLIHLGDVCMDIEAIKLLDQIKCKKRTLILGNYDTDNFEKQALLSTKFDITKEDDYFKLSNEDIVYLNHYPSKAKDNYLNIVGHVHGLWKVQPNMINVSVDAWHFRPVSEKQILFIKDSMQHHYDENVFPHKMHIFNPLDNLKTNKMTKEDIEKITKEITEILLKKNEDYGGASFDLGLNGNMVHLWDKVRRYRQLIENKENKKPNFESIEDTLRDIIGYGIIGLIILKDENK